MVIELWLAQECLEKNNQRGITWKLRKGEQSFLCVTCHPNPIHIPIKLHEHNPTVTEIWHIQECLEKKLIKGA